jgi:GWxTD domain-containing protein
LLATCQFGLAHAASAEKRLAVYATSVCYNNPGYDSVALVEFPFTVNQTGLDFFRPDSADTSFYGRVFAQVTLFDSTAMPVESTNTYFSVRVEDTLAAATTEMTLFNKLGLFVKPGRYTANLSVIDAVSKRTADVFLKSVIVSAPQSTQLEISGALLAHRITAVKDSLAAAEDRLVKDGFRILANPTGTFSTSDSNCYFFAELYNLMTTEPVGKYRLSYAVLDSAGGVVQDFGFTERNKPGPTAVVVQPIDISGIKGTTLRFRVIASDPASRQADTTVLQVQRIRPRSQDFAVTAQELTVDPYDSLSLQEKINLTRYMLGPEQLGILNRLSDDGKLNFLQQWWREHDVDPQTLAIEYRLEMIKRYRFCNQYFSRYEGRNDGWSSDRGRIYMVYGPYEQIKDIPTPRTGEPFSLWYYHSLKEGKLFVFQDLRGDNEYTLVHSNMEGERFDETWDDFLKEELLDQY